MKSETTKKWFRIGILFSTTLLVAIIAIPGLAQTGGQSMPFTPSATPVSAIPGVESDGSMPARVHYDADPVSNDQVSEDASSLVGDDSADGEGHTPMGAMSVSGYTSPLVVPAADFRSDGVHPTYYNFWFPVGGIEGAQAGVSACLMAPAYLPSGATVYEVWASIYDNADFNVPLSLKRVNNYDGSVSTLADISSSGATETISSYYDATILNPVVNYPSYSYYLTVCVQPDTRLYSVRIYYRP